MRDSVRADLRVKVKRLLRKYKYPPDQQEVAVQLVIRQTEVLADGWGNIVELPRYLEPTGGEDELKVADEADHPPA